jgi:uncharacterized protein (DUF488 family)
VEPSRRIQQKKFGRVAGRDGRKLHPSGTRGQSGGPGAREDGDVYTDYHEYIQKNLAVLDEVFTQIKVSHETNGPACLMCKEADPSHCHRSALTKLLVEKYPELKPVHLMIGAHRDTESGFLPFMESGVIRILSNGQPLIKV